MDDDTLNHTVHFTVGTWVIGSDLQIVGLLKGQNLQEQQTEDIRTDFRTGKGSGNLISAN